MVYNSSLRCEKEGNIRFDRLRRLRRHALGLLPQRGVADPVQSKETVQLNSGKVFFTSTDQNGDFRIGPGLVISQATGVLSGRTFVQSLYANMTPFILAIE